MVFFGGIALPLDALRPPAIYLSYLLPATYAGRLLQDIMLRGLPGSDISILALASIAGGLFLIALGLLWWRTRAQ